MKTMTEEELDNWVAEMQSVVGGEFRQFRYNEKCLQVQFAKGSALKWLTFSMKPGVPYVFLTSERIPLVRNLKKPLALFLKTYFIGAILKECRRDKAKGRAVELSLTNTEQTLGLEFLLIPGRVNIEAVVDQKSVWANKPQPLPENQESSQTPSDRKVRPAETFLQEWSQGAVSKTPSATEKSQKKDLKKKKSGFEKMQQHLQKLKTAPWQELGEWLKENQTLNGLPSTWSDLIDPEQSLAWNIEHCFSQAKKNQAKIQGTEARLVQLKEEIEKLKAGDTAKQKTPAPSSLLHASGSKGRTVALQEGRVFIGKSGPENLKLLRKAKAWYLWLHIKDYPGAYGIIERNKGQKLPQASLEKAAQAVVSQSLPKGAKGSYQVIYAECRYVRPIKGAKAGQVTYSHEKVMTVKVVE